jgi:hypothetical protein
VSRPRARRGAALAVLAALLVALVAQAGPAAATPAPKRPHPHRKPWPITLTVRTVPAVPGVEVRLDGRPAVTDAAGRATFTQEHNFAPHTLTLTGTLVNQRDRRLKFVRWAGQRDPDQAYRSTVTGLPMRMNHTVTAGFAVQRLVTVGLVDLRKATLDPARVSSVTLRAGRDDAIPVPPSRQLWLDEKVPVYRNSAIVLQDQTYALAGVMVAGTNTVDAGRQRFKPATTTHPVFVTKFFSLAVTAHDVLFKRHSGEAARVTYPDGSVHTVPFAGRDRVVLRDLPRGSYRVTVLGGGATLPNDVTLSRDATVDLPVATHLDYGAVAAAIVAVMLLLLVLGRGRRRVVRVLRRVFHRRPARTRPPAPDRRLEPV